MAHQKNISKLEGTVDDLVFYKTSVGHLVRRKPSVNAKTIANDRRYLRTRENATEFGRASTAAKLLRQALYEPSLRFTNGLLVNRLNSRMLRVVKSDKINKRGMRVVHHKNTALLKGFGFHPSTMMSDVFFHEISHHFDSGKGIVEVNISPFSADLVIQSPKNATHFRFSAGIACVDFENKKHSSEVKHSAVYGLGDKIASIHFDWLISKGTSLPIFTVLGIEFYATHGDIIHPMENKSFNVMEIIKVNC